MVDYCTCFPIFIAYTANLFRYVGAVDGIHEYQVNLVGRKIFPRRVLQ